MLDELQQRLNMLEIETEEKKDSRAYKKDRYQYLDDKALFSSD